MSTVLTWRLAQTPEDAEVVRKLRNLGRDWFGDPTHITVEDQVAWWATNKDEVRCAIVGEPPLGYGMLRLREGRSWVSLAVDPAARGRGWGRAIYELLAQIADAPIYAAMRCDNVASRKAAERAGYVICSADPPGIAPTHRIDWIVMRYPSEQGTP